MSSVSWKFLIKIASTWRREIKEQAPQMTLLYRDRTFRSSHRRCCIRKLLLKNFAISTGSTCSRVYFWKSCRPLRLCDMIHILKILYLVIFPKYYSCVSLIISNCFLAAAQSKHWVKNLSLYNLNRLWHGYVFRKYWNKINISEILLPCIATEIL